MSWRKGLLELMRASRRILLGHADLLPYVLARPMRGPEAIRLGEQTLTLLARGGLQSGAAVDALHVLLTYTFGFVAMEAPRRVEPNPERRRSMSEAAFAAAQATPHVRALAAPMSRHAGDSTFDAGLRWLLDGLAADRRRTRRSVRRPRNAGGPLA
jgi:hypothetical protein